MNRCKHLSSRLLLIGYFILLPIATSSLLDGASELLFADDFSQQEAGGAPSLEKWNAPTNQSSPERRIHVVSEGVGANFGVEGKALRIYKNEQTIPAENTALTAANRFARGADVITVAFDFWDNPAVGSGSVVLRVGTGSVSNASRIHEVNFSKGTLSGVGGIYSAGQAARIEVVMNNSAQAVSYHGGEASVASDTFDVWIDGVQVLSNHTWGRGSLPVGSLLTGLQLASFTNNRGELQLRDLRVYEGAVIQQPREPLPPLEIFLAPTGKDTNDGLSLDSPILTVARAQQILVNGNVRADVHIRVAPGRFHGQEVVWTYTQPGQRIIFEAWDPEAPLPVFDGCSVGGNCFGGTWLRLNFSGGRHTGLEFRHLRFENYQTAISFNGNRNSETGFNGGNVIYGCYFYRIGNVFNPAVAPSTAVVRLVNSKENIIENNDFVDAINATSGGLLHAIYVAHLSDRNLILQNRFINHSGDAVRVRDYSNDNIILDNVFIRAGADGYSEWYCDQDVRDDCTKPAPECPSWGNEFRNNILGSNYNGGVLGTFRFHQGDSTTGCSPPAADSVRLRTSGNIRETPGVVDLWRHRYFDFAERGQSTISGDQADPVGDGTANLTKYALGRNPRRPIRAGELPQPDMEEGQLGLTFWRREVATGVEISIEGSNDLMEWNPVTGSVTEGEIVDGRVRVTLREVEANREEGRQFLRLLIRRVN